MAPPSMQEVGDQRWLETIKVTDYAAFGTLWIVEEGIWKDKLDRQGYDKKSIRQGHPGCSIRPQRLNFNLNAVIRMLYGTSNARKDAVIVKNVCNEPDEHLTYFGHFGPVAVALQDFRKGKVTAAPKMVLTDDEKREMMAFARKKGYIHE